MHCVKCNLDNPDNHLIQVSILFLLIKFCCCLENKCFFGVGLLYYKGSHTNIHIFNSLLPVGRYINMDPCPSELVISQTQFMSLGNFWGGWMCDNQLQLPGKIADNIKLKNRSHKKFVINIYLISISIYLFSAGMR